MAHELHDDGFHEIQLSGKQLVFLFMATTVVSIVIFLCGVLVGRGVQNARGLFTSSGGAETGDAKPGDDDAATAPATGEPTPVGGLSYPASLPARQGDPARVEPGAAAGMTPTPEAPAAVKAPESPTPAPAGAPKATAKASPAEASKDAPRRPHRQPSRRRPRRHQPPPRTAGSPSRSLPSRTGLRPMRLRSGSRAAGTRRTSSPRAPAAR